MNQSKTTLFQWALLFTVALTVILLDQLTKWIVVNNLSLYETYAPIPAFERFFHFTFVRNTGAAFGLFSFAGNVFMVVAVIASGVIIYYYRQVEGKSLGAWLMRLAMGMQMGGALGNALDRVTRGYVVDFIHVFYEPYFDYPVFNIADCGVVIGVLMLIFLLWQEDKKRKQAEAPPESDLVMPEEDQRI